MKSVRQLFTILLFALAIPVATGRAAEENKVRLLWPVPPDSPQLEFLGVFASQTDFPKTKWDEIRLFFAGEAPLHFLGVPAGIVSLPDGRVLVADAMYRNVQVFDFEHKSCFKLFKTPFPAFREPGDIAVDARGSLYVVDRGKNKILVYDEHLHPLYALGEKAGFGQVEKVGVHEQSGRIYVSDSRLDTIFVFDTRGDFLFSFGEGGSNPGQLRLPHGIAFDSEGRVMVADTGNARIQVFDREGEFLHVFRFRNQAAPLSRPWDIAIDAEDNLHIIDQGKAALITCRKNGQILFSLGATRRTHHMMGFDLPSDIHVDRQGRLFITDAMNGRFSIFQLLNEEYLGSRPVTENDLRLLAGYVEEQKESERILADTALPPVPAATKEKVARLRFLDETPLGMHTELSAQKNLRCPKCGAEFEQTGQAQAKNRATAAGG